jgi:hypothetical protein
MQIDVEQLMGRRFLQEREKMAWTEVAAVSRKNTACWVAGTFELPVRCVLRMGGTLSYWLVVTTGKNDTGHEDSLERRSAFA